MLKGTCSESRFSLSSSSSIPLSSLVLGGQRLPADLLALVRVLLGGLRVGLQVPTVQAGEDRERERDGGIG